MKTLVIASGYFNPIHIGHIKLIKTAKSLGDELLVLVNNDKQQILKKGKIIMEEDERLEIVKAIRYVDHVFLSVDEDPTVKASLAAIATKFADYKIIFANGGDRKDKKLVPEAPICEEFGIEMLFNVGGNEKANSSSDINKRLGLENADE